jgi:two-component system KDP operon response regulator KdpE
MSESELRILIVDDEAAIRRFLRASLSAHGHKVFEVATGNGAISEVAARHPDLVILDLGLPDLDGISVVRQLREWTPIPIIILSVRTHETDKIDALDAGADDYLTKPFAVGELMARIRVAMRHTAPSSVETVFTLGGMSIDLTRRVVKVDGSEIHLTPIEYDLLRILVTNCGKVITHGQLLRLVWGSNQEEKIQLLRVHMNNMRNKIEPDLTRPRYILNVPGVGYRMRTDD